jgi:hypothetical protein
MSVVLWMAGAYGEGEPGGGGGVVTPPDPPGLWLWELVDHYGVPLAELNARTRRLQLGRNVPGTASFAFDLDELEGELAELLRLGQVDVRVSYNGTPILGGPLADADVNLDALSGTVSFGMVGIAAMLEARMIPAGRSLEATEQTQIAWQLVSDAQELGWLGIAAGSLPDSEARSKTWDAPTPTLTALQELAGLDRGFDWSIVPVAAGGYRFDTFYPGQGTNRGVVLEQGRNIAGLRVRLSAAPTDHANEVTAIGASGITITVTDPTSQLVHRLRQRVVTLPDADDAVVLGDAARAALADSGLMPLPVITLAPGSEEATLASIGIGDTVEVRVTRGWLELDGPARVEAIDVTLTDEGQEALTVTTSPVLG